MSNSAPKTPDGAIEFEGRKYLRDCTGALIPIEVIKDKDLVEDGLVRDLFAKAVATSAAVSDFKVKSFADIDAFVQVLFEKYKAKVGGVKGNITLSTFDGLQEIQVQTAEVFSYGAELQAAKALIDECVRDWSATAPPELLALATDAFRADKEGNVSRSKLVALRRYQFKDPRWIEAMQAIVDAETVQGSKRYLRYRYRETLGGAWKTVSLNIATA